MRVLIVEDDSGVVQALEAMLRAEGCVVDSTSIGEDGFDIAKIYDYDIIILDLMLPDMDGYDVLQRLRSCRVTTPVLILSGLQKSEDIIKGLGIGADDYLTKPFNKEELLARVRAVTRRSKGHAESKVSVGRLSVDLQSRQAEVDGKPLSLTCKEYSILELLVMRKGSTLSKEVFLNHLYGGMDEPELKIIDVFVCKLRKKLTQALGSDDTYIETVWGRGYVLRLMNDEDASRPAVTLPEVS
ncbi:response regulator transcription factor CtrA [Candidatus Hepatobacter penaei]|jgi:two-component system cell cycle response regulator CtrA|uniref:response regulator transcription factor CtrA n=1 Tax=Candidatus Hepatobacter penaei TaxID=1274402 RepID=UPI0004F37E72|nr:response regulator transcription factor [Candidatus Hepatobacter penaei]TGW15798.1 response regulator transcription factor [bacterium NHP-B]